MADRKFFWKNKKFIITSLLNKSRIFEDNVLKNFVMDIDSYTDQEIDYISKLPAACNAQLINALMPEWTLPAIYYPGGGDMMMAATLDKL